MKSQKMCKNFKKKALHLVLLILPFNLEVFSELFCNCVLNTYLLAYVYLHTWYLWGQKDAHCLWLFTKQYVCATALDMFDIHSSLEQRF